MTKRVVVHIAAVVDLAAMLIVSFQRPIVECYGSVVLSPQNIPLAVSVLFIIITFELKSEQIRGIVLALFMTASFVFLACSFGLPPKGPSSDYYSILSYGALMYQFGVVLSTILWKSPGFGRTLVLFIVVTGLGTLAAFAYTFTFKNGSAAESAAHFTVVLGTRALGPHTPGRLPKGRLDAALLLYRKGDAGKIAATGYHQSEVEAWYLEHNGVPDSDIIMEQPPTYCTCEQANYVKKVLVDSMGVGKVDIVTNAWHLPRALLMCQWQGIDAVGVPSYTEMSLLKSIDYRLHEAAAAQVYILFGA